MHLRLWISLDYVHKVIKCVLRVLQNNTPKLSCGQLHIFFKNIWVCLDEAFIGLISDIQM